jgi:hypothetical protein
MAVTAQTITVGTTATPLFSTDTDAIPGGSIVVRAPATATLYLGGPDVNTTGNGWDVPVGTTFAVDLGPGEQLYALLATGTAGVLVLRTGA